MPFLLLSTHLFFTFRLHFVQRLLPHAIKLSFSKQGPVSQGISPYATLATSLAATIGTGNIIGISTAISIGGPGAVFWCWITGFLGVATCYSECFLSFLHRIKQGDGSYVGGPMYILSHTLEKRGLAYIFALAVILASFGMGSSVQSHSISAAIREISPISPHIIGIFVALLAGFVILGGIRQISKICTFFVPFMSLFYLFGCIWILILNHNFLADALLLIFRSAFSSNAIAGGLLGGTVLTAIRTGISRGLFTNEAGLGSIPITAASADSSCAQTQGLISMTGPFWDTVVICAITGLTIVSSLLKHPDSFSSLPPDALCFVAFSQLPFFGKEMLSLSLILFAFATILGWCCYGESGIRFLFGPKIIPVYQVAYLFFIYLGAVVSLDLVWEISDLLNALMALPNLLCLWMLRKQVTEKGAGNK